MPEIELAYYLWAVLLLCSAFMAWSLNFFALPGNWIIVGLAAAFVVMVTPQGAATGLTWQAVGLLGALALGGELLETAAGAFGAAKQGASKRAMALAIAGTIAGSLMGAVGGLPIPVAGPIVGALVGGAAGAFAGAYIGEMWKHGRPDHSVSVGWGALVGRLLGTAGKLLVGLVMLVSLAIHTL
ncbi:MAG: DUF456 domain-containing protein [Pseudomonadota bacterium]|nr:DUF456 domain-containing protein [Pseudomonadota bacterium]